jgi:hypothetical protein
LIKRVQPLLEHRLVLGKARWNMQRTILRYINDNICSANVLSQIPLHRIAKKHRHRQLGGSVGHQIAERQQPGDARE